MAEIAIVGGGVAGLAAGITAQQNGHHAVIYEKHGRAGGNLTGWDRDGYHIDNCIHWLTGTNERTDLYRTWETLGVLGNVAVYQPPTLYTFDLDGARISLSRNIEKLEEDLLCVSPEDGAEIRAFLRAVRAMMTLDGTAEKATLWNRLMTVPALSRYAMMTTGKLADRFSSPLLRGFFESLMGRSFSALALVIVFATFCGGNGGIPFGSSCAMAERMTARFLSLGGTLRLHAGVERVNVLADRALSLTLENGETAPFDYAVITTDPAAAFGALLDKERMPRALKKQYENRGSVRFSSYHCAFACDTPALPFSHDLIFPVPEEFRRTLLTEYLILREFSHEKTFAPDGKCLMQAMVYCSEKTARLFLLWSAEKELYREKKRELCGAIGQVIERKFPELAGKLTLLDCWTPATYRRFTGSEMGSFMSFVLPPKRLPKPLSPRVPGLSNVFLGTQWLRAPGGLPNAAKAGIAAAEAIL